MNLFQSPLSTHCFVTNFLEELGLVQEMKKHEVQVRQEAATIQQWIPPPTGWIKINVDGAPGKTDDIAAVAAVARSCDGEFLGASSVVFSGCMEAETVEAVAIREPPH